MLAGSRDFVERAWRLKQRWGGAMRQSGVLAAMCLYALDHNVERLADDHRLARRIGERVGGVAGVLPVETNIVILHLSNEAPDSATVLSRLAERGSRLAPSGRAGCGSSRTWTWTRPVPTRCATRWRRRSADG